MNMLYIGFDDLAIVKKSSNGNRLLESCGSSGEVCLLSLVFILSLGNNLWIQSDQKDNHALDHFNW